MHCSDFLNIVSSSYTKVLYLTSQNFHTICLYVITVASNIIKLHSLQLIVTLRILHLDLHGYTSNTICQTMVFHCAIFLY